MMNISLNIAEKIDPKIVSLFETVNRVADKLKGTSKNSDFFVRARKHRAQNRSVWVIHEDSSTELTPLSRKKCIFRSALKLPYVVVGASARDLVLHHGYGANVQRATEDVDFELAGHHYNKPL